MKHAAWIIGVVAGVTGCSGAVVGGDAGAYAGSRNGGSAGSAGGNFPMAGGSGGDPSPSGGSGGDPSPSGGSGGDPSPSGGSGGEPGPVGGGSGGGGTTEYPSCTLDIDAWIAFDWERASIGIEEGGPFYNRDIYLVRPDGSSLTRLTSDESIEKEPYFSPTGDRLSFTSNSSGSTQIYIMDLATRAVTKLTDRAEGADQSSISPDGKLVAFHSGASIFTVEPDGSNETLIATGLDDLNAYFNPKFIGNDQLVFDRNNEINAINLDKSNFRNIVANTAAMIIAPTVSPKNDEIAYASQCGDVALSIWTASVATGAPPCSGRRISPAHDPLTSTRPSWGPANKVAYERVDLATHIGRITIDDRAPGAVPCSLTDGSEDSRNPNWSPTGFKLAPDPH